MARPLVCIQKRVSDAQTGQAAGPMNPVSISVAVDMVLSLSGQEYAGRAAARPAFMKALTGGGEMRAL
jgi:hypothetical protein